MAVSYTHLDVYKRQIVRRVHSAQIAHAAGREPVRDPAHLVQLAPANRVPDGLRPNLIARLSGTTRCV